MRAIELAKVAAAAESLRLRRLARRQAIRAAMAVAAALFGFAAFAFIHVLLFIGLEHLVSPWLAAVIVVVIDAVIAGLLLTQALNSEPDRIELEAKEIRHEALRGARQATTVFSVGAELAGFAANRGARRALRSRGPARYLTLLDIGTRLLRRR